MRDPRPEEPRRDAMLIRLPRRVNMLGGTYTLNNTFLQLNTERLLNKSVYCLGFGPTASPDGLTSGEFKVTGISPAAVTTSRNALNQLPTYGDSGGTCFWDVNSTGVRESYMIGVYSGRGSPTPDGQFLTANYGNPTNYREWVDQTLFSQPVAMTAGATSSPAIVATDPGNMTLLVRRNDNAIYAQRYVNGAWSGSFESIGGVSTTDPAVASTGPGRFTVVIRSSTSELQYRDYDGRYLPWRSLAGSSSSAPAVVTDAGRLYVFVTAAGTLKYNVRDTRGDWSSRPRSKLRRAGPDPWTSSTRAATETCSTGCSHRKPFELPRRERGRSLTVS